MAADKRYEVAIQLKRRALISNSRSIEGRATFTDDIVKGVRKELDAATINAEIFEELLESASFIACILYNRFAGSTLFATFFTASVRANYSYAVSIRA